MWFLYSPNNIYVLSSNDFVFNVLKNVFELHFSLCVYEESKMSGEMEGKNGRKKDMGG